jgi:hypothetical protein
MNRNKRRHVDPTYIVPVTPAYGWWANRLAPAILPWILSIPPADGPHAASVCTLRLRLLAPSSASVHLLRRVRWVPPSLSLCFGTILRLGGWLHLCAVATLDVFFYLFPCFTAILSSFGFAFSPQIRLTARVLGSCRPSLTAPLLYPVRRI